MKTAATIFSWLGGAVQVAYYFAIGVENNTMPASIILALAGIGILVWRQYAVANGKKVACGIFTLLFASLIGGILTLCIPQDELDGYGYRPSDYQPKPYHSYQTPPPNPKLTEEEKIALLEKYKKLLDEGIITQEEFEKKKSELL